MGGWRSAAYTIGLVNKRRTTTSGPCGARGTDQGAEGTEELRTTNFDTTLKGFARVPSTRPSRFVSECSLRSGEPGQRPRTGPSKGDPSISRYPLVYFSIVFHRASSTWRGPFHRQNGRHHVRRHTPSGTLSKDYAGLEGMNEAILTPSQGRHLLGNLYSWPLEDKVMQPILRLLPRHILYLSPMCPRHGGASQVGQLQRARHLTGQHKYDLVTSLNNCPSL